jgi:DNA helicase-2/ATP-dependent DNA helicase PcrA
MKEVRPPSFDVAEVLILEQEAFYAPPFVGDEQAQLRTLLDNYQMPVTHLNNFLDVSRGGPQTFLEQILLRFPQSMGPAAAFGSSMHKAIELLYTKLRKDGFSPIEETVLGWFEKELLMKRLSDSDTKLFLKRGKDALSVYYKAKLSEFDPGHFIELNFKNQGVLIGDAHITGKIDKMIPRDGGEYEVVDFKTGHAVDKWLGTTPYEKVKLHNYKRQIIFYKLLVENSRDFSERGTVNRGKLEFLEPKNGKIIELPLEIQAEDVERTRKLIEVVYKKIMTLDFPDVSGYSKDVKGVEEFEEDMVFDRLARDRFKSIKKTLTHKEVWD